MKPWRDDLTEAGFLRSVAGSASTLVVVMQLPLDASHACITVAHRQFRHIFHQPSSGFPFTGVLMGRQRRSAIALTRQLYTELARGGKRTRRAPQRQGRWIRFYAGAAENSS